MISKTTPDEKIEKTTEAKPVKPVKLTGEIVLLDANDQPAGSISLEDLKALAAASALPLRIQLEDGRLFERAGSDEDGRPTYRPS